MELIVENVRCFKGRHKIPIRPLTILVGENSSGKTTVLAALAAVFDPFFPYEPRLNYPPYDLGSFDTIATASARRGGRAKQFSLGYAWSPGSENDRVETLATYESSYGAIRLAKVWLKQFRAEAYIRRTRPGSYHATLTLRDNGKVDVTRGMLNSFLVGHPTSGLLYSELMQLGRGDTQWYANFGQAFPIIVPPRSRSIAPLRMKPQRIYDQVREVSDPEGSHIPSVLERHLTERTRLRERARIFSALRRFGQEAGLFKKITVKRRGGKPGEPFQVLVGIANGMVANLIDVGYGVSQALPVIVESVLLGENDLLLVQQPEVHLHPRAQAALGSFFVEMVAKSKKNLVIETHSDFILDRIRMEIAGGKLPTDSFLILYFERKGTETTVYPLTVDSLGNLNGVPPTYREFFLREEMNFLTRGG